LGADEQGMQIYHRRRRGYRRAQLVSGRVGDELSRPAGARFVYRERRGADGPQHDPRRRAGSKILIDATRKHAYPPPARVPREHIEAAQKKWKEYGFL